MAALARAFSSEASSPLAQAVRDFLGHLARRGASVNTIAAYRGDLEQLAYFVQTRQTGGSYSTVDRATIEQFVAGLKESGYRDASIARKLAAARSFFVFLASEGALSADPTAGYAGPRVARVLPRAAGAKEIARLLQQPARVAMVASALCASSLVRSQTLTFLSAPPLPITGAVGSPVNPLAVK